MRAKRVLQAGLPAGIICCAALLAQSCQEKSPAVAPISRSNLLNNLKSDTEARRIAEEFWTKRIQTCGDVAYELLSDEGVARYEVMVAAGPSGHEQSWGANNLLLRLAYTGHEWVGHTWLRTKHRPEERSWDTGRQLNLYKRAGRWYVGGYDSDYAKGDLADELVDIRNLVSCDELIAGHRGN